MNARQKFFAQFVSPFIVVGLLFAASFWGAWPALAQGDAAVSGTIRDVSGAGVPLATVRVNNHETGEKRELQTDSDGRFRALALPVGRYDLALEKTGFRVEKRTGIVLVASQHEELNLTLQLGDTHQIAEVTADPGSLAASTFDNSGLVGERQVKDLPLNCRSYDQLLTLHLAAGRRNRNLQLAREVCFQSTCVRSTVAGHVRKRGTQHFAGPFALTVRSGPGEAMGALRAISAAISIGIF